MYNFITIMYDVFSCFGVLAKNQNTRDIRNIKNFSSHQHSLGDMFDELINIIDKEQVLSTEQRKVIFRRYEDLYVKLMHYSVFTDKTHQIIKQKYFNDIVPMILALDIRNTYRPDNEMAFTIIFILFSLRYRIMRMIYIMLQGHICEITLSYVYLDTHQRMRISKISLMAYMNSFVIFAKTVHQEKQNLSQLSTHAKKPVNICFI